MRKKVLLIVIPGLIIGLVMAVVITTAFKYATSPEAALLQPFRSKLATAADKQIELAQAAIQHEPGDPRGYNSLAAAFMQKSRESGDFTLNARADESLKHSFRVSPENYEGLKLQAALMLTYHRFAEALQIAEKAQIMNHNDHEIYGALVDAHVELGQYEQAVDAAQKMIDLRPDTSSYSRVSYLRALHGDTKGAIEMMKMAVEAASPANVESVAWCRVHLGDELMNDDNPSAAERQYDQALYAFPEYHAALAAKARARYAAGDTENAIGFYKHAIERTPLPDYIAALGDLYAKTGHPVEAQEQFDQVEFIEKLGSTAGTYSRQLALFWLDHDIRLDEALTIAENEHAMRQDIYGSDILAWALFKVGRYEEAQTAMADAMRLKTQDARLFYHAGLIAAANHDEHKAAEYLDRALKINPFFDVRQAEIAKKRLAELIGK